MGMQSSAAGCEGSVRALRCSGPAKGCPASSAPPGTPENETALLRRLADEDDSVTLAAVTAAARLKCDRAVPLLASCLRRKSAKLAKAAAAALAGMPPEGLQVLEAHINNSDPIAAEAAREMVACGVTAGVS